MPLDQREGSADAGQHAERQDVDLENAERVEIVLVPFDDGAVRHRRVFDRHQFGQRPAGDDEAADVLRQVPRKADQLVARSSARRRLRSRGSSPASRTRSSAIASFDQPQTMPASAATTSSDNPSALPTSRIAPRAR